MSDLLRGDPQQLGEARGGIGGKGQTRPVLAHLPVLQDQDVVGVGDRVQPVRHDDAGAALEQPAERRVHQPLGGRVEARGRLVQDHQVGVAQEDARAGQHLRLPGREPDAAVAQQRVQPVAAAPAASRPGPARPARRRSASSGTPSSKRVRLSRTLASKRWTSWVTRPMRARTAARRTVAQVHAAQAHHAGRRIVEARQQRASASSCRCRCAPPRPAPGPAPGRLTSRSTGASSRIAERDAVKLHRQRAWRQRDAGAVDQARRRRAAAPRCGPCWRPPAAGPALRCGSARSAGAASSVYWKIR